jgi:hypothetical protein
MEMYSRTFCSFTCTDLHKKILLAVGILEAGSFPLPHETNFLCRWGWRFEWPNLHYFRYLNVDGRGINGQFVIFQCFIEGVHTTKKLLQLNIQPSNLYLEKCNESYLEVKS